MEGFSTLAMIKFGLVGLFFVILAVVIRSSLKARKQKTK